MNKKLTFSFIGGDLRQLRVISGLEADGYNIRVLGFEGSGQIKKSDNIYVAQSVEDALSDSEVVVLPLPYTTGDEVINAPFATKKIYISDVLRKLSDEQILFAGRMDEQLKMLSELYGVHTIDYMSRDELAVLNAIPTAFAI